MLIATTEGLTVATTSAIAGNTVALLSIAGREKLGSIGVAVEVAGGLGAGLGAGLGDGEIPISGNTQLVPRTRETNITRQVKRYFIFTLFIILLFYHLTKISQE